MQRKAPYRSRFFRLSMRSAPGILRCLRLSHSQRSAAMGSMARALRAGTMQASAVTRMSSPDAAKTMIGSRVPLSIQRGKSKNDVARPLTARGMHREWRAAMPKDLAQVDYVREFIDLLEKNAPTVK